MPLITHHKDPFNIIKKQAFNVESGINFLEWLCKTYGDVNSMSGELSTDIILNGKTIFQTDKDSDEKLVDFTIGENDSISIVNRPGSDLLKFSPAHITSVAIFDEIASALSPSLPGDAGESKESPNNSLQAANNSFRVGQAIPEIFGNVISFPDFIQPSSFEYINNLKIVNELFCIGEGQGDIIDVKSGETLISNIPGSSSQIFPPGVTPGADLLTIHRGTNEIDGQVLISPDELAETDQVKDLFLWTASEVGVTLKLDSTLISDLGLLIGDFITIDVSPSLINGTFEISGFTNIAGEDVIILDTTSFTAGTATSSTITKTDSSGNLDNWVGFFDVPGDDAEEIWFHWQMPQGIRSESSKEISIDLEFEIEILSAGIPTGTVFTQSITKTGESQDPQFTTTKFNSATNPGMIASQYRARVKRNTDLFEGSAGQQVKIENFVSVTPYSADKYTQTNQVKDLFLWTALESAVTLNLGSTLISDLGLLVGDFITIVVETGLINGEFEINGFTNIAGEDVIILDTISFTPGTATSSTITKTVPPSELGFGDLTLLSVERKATTFAVTSSSSKINCDYTRKLPTYNRITGFYDVNTLVATRDFADAVAYEIIVAAGRSASTIDLIELYEINDALAPDLRHFDFTFDDFNVSLGERVQAICNVARVATYRDGAIWRFTRDELKPFRTALFNRRIMPDAENSSQGWQLQRPDDKDSISLSYVDPEDNVERIIYRRVENGVILSDFPGNHPLEIKLTGCRGLAQADNRANLEIRRLIYQRRTVSDTVHRDGLLVGLNSRVGWVDPNDVDLFDGEILGFFGNEFDTSERWTPETAVNYSVYITDNDGNPSNTVSVTPRVDTEFGFVATGLSGAFLPSSDEQLGSRYHIFKDSDSLASDFLITARSPNPDGTVQLEMSEYVPVIYEND